MAIQNVDLYIPPDCPGSRRYLHHQSNDSRKPNTSRERSPAQAIKPQSKFDGERIQDLRDKRIIQNDYFFNGEARFFCGRVPATFLARIPYKLVPKRNFRK